MNQSADREQAGRRTALYRVALERTVPLDEFSPSDLKEKLERTVSDQGFPLSPRDFLERTSRDACLDEHTRTATHLTEFVHDTQFPSELLTDPADSNRRYEIQGVIGKGATGRIFAMRDNGLNRTVAVKLLDKRREKKPGRKGQFIHEARVTASLEHPNIMPVHDIGITTRGELYFTMKNVEGCTLGDAIRAAKKGETLHPEFESIDGRVRIFLKVCDALTYAHSRGYIHQDVKPDNIMLGPHGEVLLLDWGSALSKERIREKDSPGLVGTPAYMSPEQARREKSDERSDIYCLGATLFHALLLRHPTWADDPETFWERKRGGGIDLPTHEERRLVPSALLDVALKALDADSLRRYQSVDELARDLKSYQAGRAVSAHRDSLLEVFLRWHRRNARLFWPVTLSVGAFLVVGWLLMREQILELMTWDLLFTESFSYDHTSELNRAWEYRRSDDWVLVRPVPFSQDGGWRVDSGALVGDNRNGFDNITFRRRLSGDIKVEWEATPFRKNQNLNCYIAGETRFDGYTFHLGGWNSPKNFVLTKGPSLQVLDFFFHPKGLEIGKTYRFEMEKEGPHIRLFLDGQKLFDYKDPAHLSGLGHQTFGFENSSLNFIRIDNVKVYYHPLPLKVTPLVAADRSYHKGRYAEAREQYQEIYQVYPNNEIAPLAFFGAARCLIGMDSVDAALRDLWLFGENYPRHELVPLSIYERARLYELRGRGDAADSFYRALGQRFPGHAILRTILFNMTNRHFRELDSLLDAVPEALQDSSFFAQLLTTGRSLQSWAHAFNTPAERNPFLERLPGHLHRYYPLDSIVAWFPDQPRAVAELLLQLGHYERVIAGFADQEDVAAAALMAMGHYRRVVDEYPRARGGGARSLLALGQYQQVLDNYRDQRYSCGMALLGLNRFQEIVEGYKDQTYLRVTAAQEIGRLRSIVQEKNAHPWDHAMIRVRVLNHFDSVAAFIDEGGLLARHERWRQAHRQLLRLSGRDEELLRIYGDSLRHAGEIADALSALGRDEEVLRRFASLAQPCIQAHKNRGEFDSVVQKYPDYLDECIQAEREMGRGGVLFDRFEHRLNLRASLLLEQGELERVVAEFPDQSESAAYALLALGRYDELLSRYPHEHERCREALAAKGVDLDSILSVHPSREWAAEYLYDAGRYRDVVGSYADVPYWYSLALARLGRAPEIPYEKGFHRLNNREYLSVIARRAIWMEESGNRGGADSLLALPVPFSYGWHNMRFNRFLLAPLLDGFRGKTSLFDAACRRLLEEQRHRFGSKLWYEAAYLCGRIGEQEFRSQPCRFKIESRLNLLNALRADLRGDRMAAMSGYTTLLNLRPFECDEMVRLGAVTDLARWRMRVLADRR